MENCKSMIVLSAAMTLDGKIGQRNKKVVLSSKSDKIRVHKLRSKFDAILVGKNTVEQDDPLLTVRHAKGKNPIRIILDSHGTIKNTSKIIKTAKNIPTIIVTSQLVSKRNFSRLKNLPLDVIVCGKNQVDIRKLKELACNIYNPFNVIIQAPMELLSIHTYRKLCRVTLDKRRREFSAN